jgi:uncharacterized protein
MAFVSVMVEGRPKSVCERCELADNPLKRLRGLLGRGGLEPGEGVLLRPARAIHTCFMRFPIDAVFVDRELVVVAMSQRLRPWRFARGKGAHSVVELRAGECGRLGVVEGDRLLLSAPPEGTGRQA